MHKVSMYSSVPMKLKNIILIEDVCILCNVAGQKTRIFD